MTFFRVGEEQGSSPEKSPRLLEQDKTGEQMLKGGETEQEEEGAGEVFCVVTDLVFETCCFILTVPSSCPFLHMALGSQEGNSLDLMKAVTCVTEGVKVILELFFVALSRLLMCHFSVLVCRLWRRSG